MAILSDFIKAVQKKGYGVDGAVVIQNDDILDLHRFTDNTPHNVFSVSKSFTATAVGILMDEGLLKLTDRPIDLFPESIPGNLDPRWESITIQHLLTMNTGHGKAWLMAKERDALRGIQNDVVVSEREKADWLYYAFTRPLIHTPGTRTVYGNLAPYIVGRIVEKTAKRTMREFIYETLWKPQGVPIPRWDPDVQGHTFPASYLFLDIVDMCKLGQLVLHKGLWEGKRIVSEEYLTAATSPQVPSQIVSPTGVAKDQEYGYGYYWWMSRYPGVFYAYGREGQFIVVDPKTNAVIGIQSMHSDVQQILDLVWETIYQKI